MTEFKDLIGLTLTSIVPMSDADDRLTFTTDDEAVQIGNATAYGLASAVWTNDLSRARRVSKALRMGTVWVNCYEEGDLTVPFGGVKQSGFGSDKSLHAMDKFTDLKTTWIDLS